MSRHLCFYNNDTLLQDNSEPGYFTEYPVPDNTNLIVCYDDDYKITCNIRVTASSNQDMINYQYATDSALFLLKSLQNYTQNQSVRAQITVSNIAKDSNNLAQDIQSYLQTCGVSSGSSIDFSTIVTALNSITSALSALTNLSNLSNLANLANIVTAITNKDNQTEIKNMLRSLFTYSPDGVKFRSLFSGLVLDSSAGSSYDSQNYSIQAKILGIVNALLSTNMSFTGNFNSISLNTKLFTNLLALNGYGNDATGQIPNNVSLNITNSVFKQIRDKISNIETKLEQNLPFTTIVENDIVETNVAQNCSYGSKIEQIPFTE